MNSDIFPITIDFSNFDARSSINHDLINNISFLKDWYSNKASFVVKTSGSTGTPKEINISRDQMIISVNKTADFLDLNPKQTCLICLSTNTILH